MSLLLLACAGIKPPEPAAEPTGEVRVVDGPWSQGDFVALAATGPKTLEGQWQGPAIVLVGWLQEGKLLLSSTFDGGQGWTAPKIIGMDLEPPLEMDLALGSPVLLAHRAGVAVLLQRTEDGWEEQEVGQGPAELAVIDGRHVLALTTPEGLVVDGELAWPGTVCGPAALRREGLTTAVAFRERQEDGSVEVRLIVEAFDDDGALAWEDRGLQTSSGWSPEVCPPEGPAFDGERVIVSDGRDGSRGIWAGDKRIPTEPGWEVLEVAAAAGILTWTAEQGSEHRLLVDGVSLLTSSEHRYELGEPADVAGEVWLPFRGIGATIAAYRPAPELD